MPRRQNVFQQAHGRGFTLVEVLVALAVLAIALAALMRSLAQSIDTSYVLREHTLAAWVAQDRLVMHQLKLDWPSTDTTDGENEVSGEKWFWREKVIATPEPKMRRIEITIRRQANSQNYQAMLVGYLRQPKN